jgi:ADP-ribose pyrophosphatase YjhB (NUDIX family)
MAALRETREEGSVRAEIVGLLGVQEIPPPWYGQIAILYLCRHVDGEPAPDYDETDAARYFTDSDIDTLSEPVEPFSYWLVRRVLNGQASLIHEHPTNPFRPKTGHI